MYIYIYIIKSMTQGYFQATYPPFSNNVLWFEIHPVSIWTYQGVAAVASLHIWQHGGLVPCNVRDHPGPP